MGLATGLAAIRPVCGGGISGERELVELFRVAGSTGTGDGAQRLTLRQSEVLARPVAPGELNVAQAAEESCRIVGTPGYYPGRKVDTAYIEQFTPVMEARLVLAGARLAAALNRVWQ